MSSILGFDFLYHVLQFVIVCHVRYTPFTCDQKLSKSKILKYILNFSNFEISQLLNFECFLNGGIGYY
jgi:hypothetical protein